MGHYPFGDPWYNATNDKLVFTTYERDAESGNDYAQARFYRWLLGRFLSLDPLSGSTSDPQSLDRYTYVENNPTNLVDPSGMDECLTGDYGACSGGGGGYGYGDFGFSAPLNSSPCLAGCGYTDRYGVFTGSATYTLSGYHQGDPDSGIFSYWDLLTITFTDPLQNRGGPGGGGGGGTRGRSKSPNVDVIKLDLCTSDLYGIRSLSFSLSQPTSASLPNGLYAGINMNILAPQQPINGLFTVTNDPTSGTNFGGFTEQGHVFPDNPYITETHPGLLQPFLAATQITELGNSLGLISGTYTAQQELKMDQTPTQNPNALLNNLYNTPGIALLDCLMKNGGFNY